MDGPDSNETRTPQAARRAWSQLVPRFDAVLEHLRYNWTDGILALGFIVVILLSAYLILKG